MNKSALLLLLIASILSTSCEGFYNPPTSSYPARFTFSGTVWDGDSVPIPFLRITLKTPNNMDSVTAMCNESGFYEFIASLEYSGPNRLIIRDIDQSSHGGWFAQQDTVFYITTEQYESRKVRHDFILTLR
jgi:hypothetical protein